MQLSVHSSFQTQTKRTETRIHKANILIIHKLISSRNEMPKQQWLNIHLPLNDDNERQQYFSWHKQNAPLDRNQRQLFKWRGEKEKSRVAAESKAKTADGYCSLRFTWKTYKQYFCLHEQNRRKKSISFLFEHNRIYTKTSTLSRRWDLWKNLITKRKESKTKVGITNKHS